MHELPECLEELQQYAVYITVIFHCDLLDKLFGMIYFHVNTRVESIAINLDLWVCMCFVTATPMSYIKQYEIRHKPKYSRRKIKSMVVQYSEFFLKQ